MNLKCIYTNPQRTYTRKCILKHWSIPTIPTFPRKYNKLFDKDQILLLHYFFGAQYLFDQKWFINLQSICSKHFLHLGLFGIYDSLNILKKYEVRTGYFYSHRLFQLWVARLWIWCYGAVDRIAEMKINTGIYIFCSPAWLVSSKCISDLNLNNRDQPLPALHSIRCQEIPCCH